MREGGSSLPILMVTARVAQADKREGFRAGTDDYMVKPVDEEEMLWRIEALLRRSRSAAEQRLTVGGTVLDYRAMSATCGGKPVPLSAKEFQLLYKLLSYPETLLTKRQLIDELWDLDSDVDEHTVEVHISRLREKFRGCPDFHIRTIRVCSSSSRPSSAVILLKLLISPIKFRPPCAGQRSGSSLH